MDLSMMPIFPDGRDEMIDESTIDLFRQYLKEAIVRKSRKIALNLTWLDN